MKTVGIRDAISGAPGQICKIPFYVSKSMGCHDMPMENWGPKRGTFKGVEFYGGIHRLFFEQPPRSPQFHKVLILPRSFKKSGFIVKA